MTFSSRHIFKRSLSFCIFWGPFSQTVLYTFLCEKRFSFCSSFRPATAFFNQAASRRFEKQPPGCQERYHQHTTRGLNRSPIKVSACSPRFGRFWFSYIWEASTSQGELVEINMWVFSFPGSIGHLPPSAPGALVEPGGIAECSRNIPPSKKEPKCTVGFPKLARVNGQLNDPCPSS